LIQAKIKNLIGLVLAERITPFGQAGRIANENADLFDLFLSEIECKQFDSRFFAIGRPPNDANEFVEIRECNQITFESLGAFFGFL